MATTAQTNRAATTATGQRSGNAKVSRRRHRHATQQAIDANTTHVNFRIGDTTVDVSLPPLNKLAFYAGLGAGAAFGLIEWPIALLTGVGHLLSDDRHNSTLQALG